MLWVGGWQWLVSGDYPHLLDYCSEFSPQGSSHNVLFIKLNLSKVLQIELCKLVG